MTGSGKSVRFATPWRIIEHPESFEVQTSAAVTMCFIYYEDEPTRRSMKGRLSKAEAQRFADAVVKIPDEKRKD